MREVEEPHLEGEWREEAEGREVGRRKRRML